jgi:hypothetical protein
VLGVLGTADMTQPAGGWAVEGRAEPRRAGHSSGHRLHGSPRRLAGRCGILLVTTENEEDTVAERSRRIDPTWPDLPDGEHPVTELASPLQGSLSPFGDVEFPLDEVPYVHPRTEINR